MWQRITKSVVLLEQFVLLSEMEIDTIILTVFVAIVIFVAMTVTPPLLFKWLFKLLATIIAVVIAIFVSNAIISIIPVIALDGLQSVAKDFNGKRQIVANCN